MTPSLYEVGTGHLRAVILVPIFDRQDSSNTAYGCRVAIKTA